MKKIIIIAFSVLILLTSRTTSAQTNVVVNPQNKYQTIEGWGASLCWWAVVMGGFSESKVDEICKWIASPDELNMNVFRYNIGGGENPGHHHMRQGADVPGFKTSASAAYDWNRDPNQRKIVVKLNALRKDVINEAFSNSPPYWMTKSGCAAGNNDGSDNLKDDQYGAFADYLTEVVKHYKEKVGITFRTVDPFNEPYSGWWTSGHNQEGCKFGQNNQQKMIPELYKALSNKNMLDYTGISAMDANSLDDAVNGVYAYDKAGLISKITQINAHTYGGGRKSELAGLAKKHNKRLWQSESGPLGVNSSGIDNYLVMARRLIEDLRDMKCVVWCDWQIGGDNEPSWSLINANYGNQSIGKNKSFYVRMQCSRFIKQGYTIIESNQGNTVAAINPDGTELVVVVCNQNGSSQSLNLDLSAFKTVNTPAMYRTSDWENCVKSVGPSFNNKKLSYSAPGKSITTFVVPLGSGVTGIEENSTLNSLNVVCSPSPFSHDFRITSNETFDYNVFNLEGQEIESGKGEDGMILGQDWTAGLYIVKVMGTNGSRFVKVTKI